MLHPTAATEYRILLIEDDPGVRQFLRLALTSQGFQVTEALTGREGLTYISERRPDLVLLDLGLPDMDGLTITKQLREWTSLPIIILSGKRHENDKVRALNAGADDYITKPYGLEELVARVRVALRHTEQAVSELNEPRFTVGELTVDLVRRQVFLGGQEVSLSPTEYNLLAVLVRHAGSAVTHRQLLREVWGPQCARQSNYVRIYIKHLRRKLGDDPASPRYLISEPSIGYRLTSE